MKLMAKSGGKRTFLLPGKRGALGGSRWESEVFVDSNHHLVTIDSPSDSRL